MKPVSINKFIDIIEKDSTAYNWVLAAIYEKLPKSMQSGKSLEECCMEFLQISFTQPGSTDTSGKGDRSRQLAPDIDLILGDKKTLIDIKDGKLYSVKSIRPDPISGGYAISLGMISLCQFWRKDNKPFGIIAESKYCIVSKDIKSFLGMDDAGYIEGIRESLEFFIQTGVDGLKQPQVVMSKTLQKASREFESIEEILLYLGTPVDKLKVISAYYDNNILGTVEEVLYKM